MSDEWCYFCKSHPSHEEPRRVQEDLEAKLKAADLKIGEYQKALQEMAMYSLVASTLGFMRRKFEEVVKRFPELTKEVKREDKKECGDPPGRCYCGGCYM